MSKKKLIKKLNKLDYYCLKRYGFSIFDKKIQKTLGVKENLSLNFRAVSVARKMLFVLKDKILSNHIDNVFLHIKFKGSSTISERVKKDMKNGLLD